MNMYNYADSSHIEQDHGTTHMFGRGTRLLAVLSELVELPTLVTKAG